MTRHFFRQMVLVIAVFALFAGTANAQVFAAGTIGATLAEAKSLVDKIEKAGHSLIDHGDVVAGRQQLLLAATLRSTIEKTEQSCSNILDKAADSVDAQRQGAARDLRDLARRASEMEGKTAADVQNSIYSTASQANAILGRLPFVKHMPVYFGASTKDMLTTVDKAGPDLELLGFFLTDTNLPKGTHPDVKINNTLIPPKNVFGTFDRLKIQLPDDLRKKIRTDSSPCDPPRSFTVELSVPVNRVGPPCRK